jgi:hypothetical protein
MRISGANRAMLSRETVLLNEVWNALLDSFGSEWR